MNLHLEKISPWNWFKKEAEAQNLPVSYKQSESPAPVRQLQQDIARVFNDLLPDPWAPLDQFGGMPSMVMGFKPLLDIKELDDKYHIEVDVPGVKKNDIKIEILDDILKISGEKSMEKEESRENYHCIERGYGAFERTLILPENADKEGINVHYEEGVLEIDIDKDADIDIEPHTRQIEIS
jgi:HSP20 family protein